MRLIDADAFIEENKDIIDDWRALLIAWEENQKNYTRTPEPTQKEYEYLQNDYSRQEIDSLVGDPLADLAQIMECAT